MPGRKPTRTASWAWFKAELERRLGKAKADALFQADERRVVQAAVEEMLMERDAPDPRDFIV